MQAVPRGRLRSGVQQVRGNAYVTWGGEVAPQVDVGPVVEVVVGEAAVVVVVGVAVVRPFDLLGLCTTV